MAANFFDRFDQQQTNGLFPLDAPHTDPPPALAYNQGSDAMQVHALKRPSAYVVNQLGGDQTDGTGATYAGFMPGPSQTSAVKPIDLRPDTNKYCPPVPNGGPGITGLQRNMRDARNLAAHLNEGSDWSLFDQADKRLAAGMAFADRVRTDGVWDTKDIKDESGKKLYPQGEEFGDFQYGALAHSMGYDWPATMLAAHAYSIKQGRGLEGMMPTIRQGYLYSANGCK